MDDVRVVEIALVVVGQHEREVQHLLTIRRLRTVMGQSCCGLVPNGVHGQ